LFACLVIVPKFAAIQCLLILPRIEIRTSVHPLEDSTFAPSSLVDGMLLLPSLNSPTTTTEQLPFSTKGFKKDRVMRIMDANTVKLQTSGIVTLAGVRTPTPGSASFKFPECFTNGPTYKLRQLLPTKTDVLVKVFVGNNNNKAVVIRSEDKMLVNQELVKAGFAKVQKTVNNPEWQAYLDVTVLQSLQEQAKEKGLGIFKRCDEASTTVAEAQFEPLELTTETQWGDDGGKLVLRQLKTSQGPPKNPGDIRGTYHARHILGALFFLESNSSALLVPGCSDFSTYEDALRWFEYYKSYYGDVAKLDRDGDGVPCPGLPHTKVADKYRMKVPDNNAGR
jgi:endonuclease YncB( thermonuclease family)